VLSPELQSARAHEGLRQQNMQGLHVAFVVGGLHTEGSGVARILCDLANALRRQGAVVTVYTAACDGRGATDSLLRPDVSLVAPRGWWAGRLAYSPRLKRLLHDAIAEIDVVHNHSLWMLPTSYATRAAAERGVPVVFTLHGFLETWALARSRWKKRLVGWAFQNRDLRLAACIHVNSVTELQNARKYGLRNPAAVVPNGVDLEPFTKMPPRSEFVGRFPHLQDKRICLFLSRLHRKKGLEHLVQAWGRVSPAFPDWHLVIAGPDDGMENWTRNAIGTLGLNSAVTLTGPLYGRDKLAAYAAADVFVLPSFSEGFSMAVLEAMAAGLPVLITPGCNFPEAVEAGAAVCVEPTVDGTEAGLRTLLELSDAERDELGRRARQLIQRCYTWDRVAKKMLELYQWLLGGGRRPEFVEA